jgi:hypothetical protein
MTTALHSRPDPAEPKRYDMTTRIVGGIQGHHARIVSEPSDTGTWIYYAEHQLIVDALRADRDRLTARVAQLEAERAKWSTAAGVLAGERDSLAGENEKLRRLAMRAFWEGWENSGADGDDLITWADSDAKKALDALIQQGHHDMTTCTTYGNDARDSTAITSPI